MIRRQRNAFRLRNSELKSDELFGRFDVVVVGELEYDSIVLKPVIFESLRCSLAAGRNKDQLFDVFEPVGKICQKLRDDLAFEAARSNRSSDNHQFTRAGIHLDHSTISSR